MEFMEADCVGAEEVVSESAPETFTIDSPSRHDSVPSSASHSATNMEHVPSESALLQCESPEPKAQQVDYGLLQCESCSYKTANKHYFRQHVDLVHNNERPFKCPFCDYAGKRSHSLKEHLVVHSDERPYQCTQCNATFRKKGHLTNHYRMHSSGSISLMECALCDPVITFDNQEALYKHQRKAHSDRSGNGLFLCNRCEYCTTVEGSLHLHEMAHTEYRTFVSMKPKLPPSATIILKCTDCGFETSARRDLEAHVMAKHSDKLSMSPKLVPTSIAAVVTVASPLPPGSIKTENSLSGKKVTLVASRAVQLPEQMKTMKMKKCGQCDFQSDDMSKMLVHMVKHKPSLSETISVYSTNLLQRKEPLTLNTLDETGTGFSLGEKTGLYHCNICRYYCDTQRTIKAHMWRHSGHKNLQYPTFQNGPLSVYDGTPLAASHFINKNNNKVSSTQKVAGLILTEASTPSIKAPAVTDATPIITTHSTVTTTAVAGVTTTSSNPRVIVESVNDGSERACLMPVSQATSPEIELSSPPPLTRPILPVVETCTVTTAPTERKEVIASRSATEESAATLLSLLRQGPNLNPAWPGNCEPPRPSPPIPETDDIKDSATETDADSGHGGDLVSQYPAKPRKGICSSLLAVIEQLRERQVDVESDPVTSKTRKRKRRPPNRQDKKAASEDLLSTETYPNAEHMPESDDTSNSEPVYRCRLCHYSANATLMKQHMKMHKNKQPHECSLCDFVAASNNDLQDHMIQHCKSRQFSCKTCPAVFNYKSQLRAHTRVHEDGQAFYCDHCDFVTSQIDAFQDHLSCHSKRTTGFSCIACRQRFPDLEPLRLHMKNDCVEVKRLHNSSSDDSKQAQTTTDDNGRRTLKCEQCDFVALSIRSLKSHLKRHVNDKRYIRQPLEQYKCNMCGYVCHHLPSLKSHMWRHAGDSNFFYTFSDLLTKGSTPTDKHGKPLVTLRCCQCGFETLEKAQLDSHMTTHWDIIKKTFEINSPQ